MRKLTASVARVTAVLVVGACGVTLTSCVASSGDGNDFHANHVIRLCNKTSISGCQIQITYFALHEAATNNLISSYQFVSNPLVCCNPCEANELTEFEITIPGTGAYDLIFKASPGADTEIYWQDFALQEGGYTDVGISWSRPYDVYVGDAGGIPASGSSMVCQ